MESMGPVSEWLEQSPNPQTRMAYRSAVFFFLSVIYEIEREKKITPELAGRWEEIADRYLKENRNFADDLFKFAKTLSCRPPKTARQYLAAVKDWLTYNDVSLSVKEMKKLKQLTPKGGAVTVEKDLDPETLRSILHHLSLMMRALVLLMASSGMRISEALRLTLDDIDLKGDIGKITVRGEKAKNKQQRYTFCSSEAAEAIREWIKKRDAYLISSQYRGRGLGIEKSRDDARLFPFSDSVAGPAWETAVKAAGLHSRDPVTGRLQIHIHMCRKFCSSQLKIVVPPDIVELITGHSGYLSDAYRRYTRKQVEEFYRKGEPYVTIQITEEMRELRTTTDKKMQVHSEIMEDLIHKQIAQQKLINELTDRIQLIEQYPEN